MPGSRPDRMPSAATALRILIGYGAAVLVAVVFVVALFFLTEKEVSGLLTFVAGLYAGAVITTFSALPGFLVTATLAARRGWSTWPPYAFAGALNAFAADLIFNLWSAQPLFTFPAFLLTCIPGGFAGGIVYWAIVGRLVGKRNRVALA